jgi:hypothetical protein
VANIGDSRIILGKLTSKGVEAQEVSIDHKPDRPDEQKRIESCGGRVFAVEYDDGVDGPARVWLGHMDIPGLAMSRSLGDSVAHTAGVLSEPEITQTEVNGSHKVCALIYCVRVADSAIWCIAVRLLTTCHVTVMPEPATARLEVQSSVTAHLYIHRHLSWHLTACGSSSRTKRLLT